MASPHRVDIGDEDTQVLTDGYLADAVRGAYSEDEDDPEIREVYILGDDDKVISIGDGYQDIANAITEDVRKSLPGYGGKEEILKYVEGSTQNQNEAGQSSLSASQEVGPPYPPELMSVFLQVDETHFRSVRTKVTDAVGRAFILEPSQLEDGAIYDPSKVPQETKSRVEEEARLVRNFIEDANPNIGFEGVLDRIAMDYEGIGWAAMEIIRGHDKRVVRIDHIPASRVRVLRGWKGFTEQGNNNTKVYYQNFGEKVVSTTRTDPFSNSKLPYSPREDGDIGSAEWNLIDRTTGQPTGDLSKAANEILWIPKHHSATVYYGYCDVYPAVGSVLSNVYIRDYTLQFFEHNTIPRYAIIVTGTRMTDQVKEAITKFFSQEIKGKAHKTLLIPVPAAKGEVTITFEKLAEDNQEGSFQETRKNNASSIMVAHGVSPAIIGVHDTASLGSGKGLSQAEIYKDRIVGPIQRRFAKVFTQLFRTGLGLKMVAIKFSPLDIRDLEGEMRTLTGYAKVGAMTVNRMISRAGLGDPLEGGDRPFIIVPGMGVAFLDELEKTAKLGQDAMMARNTKPPGSGGEDKVAGTAPSPNENSKKGGAP